MYFAVPPHCADQARRLFRFRAETYGFIFQIFENPGYADYDRNAVVVNEANKLARMKVGCERRSPFEEERDEKSLRLAEHMAQRQQIENPNGLEQPCPLSVSGDFILEGTQIRADIPMPVHDTPGLTGGSRGVDDFDNIVRRYGSWGKVINRRQGGKRIQHFIADNKFRLRAVPDAADEIL